MDSFNINQIGAALSGAIGGGAGGDVKCFVKKKDDVSEGAEKQICKVHYVKDNVFLPVEQAGLAEKIIFEFEDAE